MVSNESLDEKDLDENDGVDLDDSSSEKPFFCTKWAFSSRSKRFNYTLQ